LNPTAPFSVGVVEIAAHLDAMAAATASGNQAARVALDAVGKRFDSGPDVLANLSLAATPADFIALIGPSGCGKTTCLRLLAGLTPPTTGAITIDNLAPAAARDRLAYIFQEPTLLPWLTARRNVELPLRLRGVPSADRAAAALELLRRVDLEPAAALYPRQLSGGMKMRVSLARALTRSPGLLLLDEPFAALDEMTRNRLNEDLLRLRETAPFTAFFVTHSVSEAVFLANRLIVLAANPGRIAAELPVPFPYPRAAKLRESLEYQQLVAAATAALRAITPPRAETPR
jgi:NitT/TauT family transport system ATP-binding protein